jgi:threonine dehydrogenase-like Zn-dependent dehydrogenase
VAAAGQTTCYCFTNAIAILERLFATDAGWHAQFRKCEHEEFSRMKAAIFKGAGQPLSIETVPDPTPSPTEIVLKVARCGICGTDISMTSGHGEQSPGGSIIGHEMSGEVVAVGSAVTNFKVGDLVAPMSFVPCGVCADCLKGEPMWCAGWLGGAGGFAQYGKGGHLATVKLPENVSINDAALIEPAAVGLHGVRMAAMRPDARVLTIGAGPIALSTIFWARRLGAGPIAVTRRSSLAMKMGASAFLEPGGDLAAQCADTLGGPPEVVFDAVGKPGILGQALNCVAKRGTIVSLGFCTVPDQGMVPAVGLYKEVRLQFSMVYDMRDYRLTAEVLGASPLPAMITQTVGFDRFPATFEALRKPTSHGKVMLDPWG